MSTWKTAAMAAALTGAAALGASTAPVAHGQDRTVVAPSVHVITGGARLGVTVRDISAEGSNAGQPGGVLIEEVSEDSAASAADLRKGDIVVEYDGERVRSVRQFTRLVQESVAGRPIAMTVLRDGQRQTINATPGESSVFRRFGDDFYAFSDSLRGLRMAPPRPPAPPAAPAPPATPRWEFPDIETFVWRSRGALGITTGDLSPQLAEYFGVKEGVLVSSVQEESAAAAAGVAAGDIVTSVNDTAVATPSQLRREVQRLRAGDAFTIVVVRDRKTMTLKGKMEEGREQRRSFRTVV